MAGRQAGLGRILAQVQGVWRNQSGTLAVGLYVDDRELGNIPIERFRVFHTLFSSKF